MRQTNCSLLSYNHSVLCFNFFSYFSGEALILFFWIATSTVVSWVHLKREYKWLRGHVDITVRTNNEHRVSRIAGGGKAHMQIPEFLFRCWSPETVLGHCDHPELFLLEFKNLLLFSHQICRLLPLPEFSLPPNHQVLAHWGLLLVSYSIKCLEMSFCLSYRQATGSCWFQWTHVLMLPKITFTYLRTLLLFWIPAPFRTGLKLC